MRSDRGLSWSRSRSRHLLWMIPVFCLISLPARADAANVSVSGEATVKIPVNLVRISFTVITENKLAAAAAGDNARIADALVKLLKAKSVRDLATGSYSLQPVYQYDSTKPPLLLRFTARNQVIATAAAASAGDLIDAGLGSGANEVSIDFVATPTEMQIQEALSKATQQAYEKARSIALALGNTIGQVVSVEEQGTSIPEPMPMRAMVAMEKMAPTPIEAGTQEYTARVTMVVKLAVTK